MNKTSLINSTLVIILSSAIIIVVSLLTLPYLQAPIQAVTCDLEHVQSQVYLYYGRPQAACTDGPPNELFFHLSGGLTIGAFALTMFYLSFHRNWKIGMISSLSIASYQISEAFLETFRGFLFTGNGFFGFLMLLIIAGVVFFISTNYLISYRKKRTENWEFPTILVLMAGTVLSSFVFIWVWKEGGSGIAQATTAIVSSAIFLVIGEWRSKIKEKTLWDCSSFNLL